MLHTGIRRYGNPIFAKYPAEKLGLKHWIISGAYQVTSEDRFSLDQVLIRDVAPYLHYDFKRFALAGLESAYTAFQSNELNVLSPSWKAMQLYYSAYYFAHAMMLSCGIAVKHLKSGEVKKLKAIAQLFDEDWSELGKGTYELDLDFVTGEDAVIFVERLMGKGGAHQKLWRRFFKFIEDVEGFYTDADLPNQAEVIGEISKLKIALTPNGVSGGDWLSAMRNDLTYQHEFQVWHPSASKSQNRTAIVSSRFQLSERVRLDVGAKKFPMRRFSNLCVYLISVGLSLCDLIAGAENPSSQFARTWSRARLEFPIP